MNPFILAKVFADFQGAFYKKPLEAGFGATPRHLMQPNRAACAVRFFRDLSEEEARLTLILLCDRIFKKIIRIIYNEYKIFAESQCGFFL